MKACILFAILCFSAQAEAQKSYIGSSEIAIRDTFRLNYHKWSFEKSGVTPKGVSYISFINEQEDNLQNEFKIIYYFSSGKCDEASFMYASEALISLTKFFNESFIKAGKLRWIDEDGSTAYHITSNGDTFFLHIYSINKP